MVATGTAIIRSRFTPTASAFAMPSRHRLKPVTTEGKRRMCTLWGQATGFSLSCVISPLRAGLRAEGRDHPRIAHGRAERKLLLGEAECPRSLAPAAGLEVGGP